MLLVSVCCAPLPVVIDTLRPAARRLTIVFNHKGRLVAQVRRAHLKKNQNRETDGGRCRAAAVSLRWVVPGSGLCRYSASAESTLRALTSAAVVARSSAGAGMSPLSAK